jgi:UDP-glucose 4-epimerase
VKVLITGGAGFIGSHLAEHFQKLGDEVTVLDNFSTGSKRNLGIFSFSGKTVDGDIRDAKLIESLITDTDLVLHMAAALGVANILNSPIESISTNIAGSEVDLKFMGRTQNNHCPRRTIESLERRKISVGLIPTQRQLKRQWLDPYS